MRLTTFLVSLSVLLGVVVPHISIAIGDDFTVAALIGSDTIAPSAPTGLQVTPVSFDQINISWTASSDNIGVAGYQIWRDDLQIATTTLTSLVDTGLMASTSYSYYVTAFDTSSNISASSTPVATSTLAIPVPTPPPGEGSGNNQSSTRVPDDELTIFDWNVETEEHTIEITFKTNQFVRTSTQWGTGSSYEVGYSSQNALLTLHKIVIDSLDSGALYSFQILFFDRFGRSVGERVFTARTDQGIDTIPPPNVLNFSGVYEDESIFLEWENPAADDFSYVKILRSERFFPLDTADGIVIYEGDATSVRDKDLRDSLTRYYYSIFTYDSNGNRSSGAVTMVTLPGDIPPVEEVVSSSSVRIPVMFRQGDFEQESSSSMPIRLLQSERTFISIGYDQLPQNLKTIIVSLTQNETGQTFSFILRSNNDRTHYEAILDAMPNLGTYTVSVEVFDYKLKTTNKNTFNLFVVADDDREKPVSWWFVIPVLLSMLMLYVLVRKVWN